MVVVKFTIVDVANIVLVVSGPGSGDGANVSMAKAVDDTVVPFTVPSFGVKRK